MFANGMYLYNEEYKPIIDLELIQQIIRLNKYPNVIFYFGNNEIDVTWKNQGLKG